MNEIKHKIKTVSDIETEYNDLYTKHKDHTKAKDELQKSLLKYYSTKEGRQEIDQSPHSTLTTEDAVELLMRDYRGKGIKKNGNK